MRLSLTWLFRTFCSCDTGISLCANIKTTVLLQVSFVASTNAQYYFGRQKEDSTQQKLEKDVAQQETEAPAEAPAPPTPQPGSHPNTSLCRDMGSGSTDKPCCRRRIR